MSRLGEEQIGAMSRLGEEQIGKWVHVLNTGTPDWWKRTTVLLGS